MNERNAIEKILSQTVEIEGLLLVAQRRGTETPAMVLDRIKGKVAELSDMVQMLGEPASPAPVVEPPVFTPPASAPEPAPAPKPEPVVSEPDFNFAINDYYLFRRELFNNDDAKMKQVLDRIKRMRSVEELDTYVYQTLGFNPDQQEAKLFVDTVQYQLSKFL